MEDRKEGGAWMAVPAFGDWDMAHGVPDYSLDFSKIREMRKQNKTDISSISVGNEDELRKPNRREQQQAAVAAEPRNEDRVTHQHDEDDRSQLKPNENGNRHPPTTRKKFMSYFHCCTRA